MTRNELLTMYQQFPGALEDELVRIFLPLSDEQERISHNLALGRFITLFPTAEAEKVLRTNVAQAILRTATQIIGVKSDGKKG